jgi:Protein of unknown function (DUF3987)
MDKRNFDPLTQNEVEGAAGPAADDGELVAPIPDGVTKPDMTHHKLGKPQAVWTYRDENGAALVYVGRYDTPGGPRDKEFRPRTWRRFANGKCRWSWQSYPRGQKTPLYGRERLTDDSSVVVVVTEGEKCADLARRVFPNHAVVSAMGGAGAASQADWSPLKWRRPIIWPDHDAPGAAYAADVAACLDDLGVKVKIIDAAALVELAVTSYGDRVERQGFDVENALELWGKPDELRQAALELAKPWTPPPPPAWPKRKPIVAELKPVPAFDPDALLPDALRPWIMDEAERMPCPPDFIAAPVIVDLGSVIGARYAIKPKAHDSWLIVINLWGALVGPPGSLKSPAMAAASSPMGPLIAKARGQYEAELREYNADKAVFTAQCEGLQSRIRDAAKKSDTGDAMARDFKAFRDQAPKEPTLRRYKTNDPTVESLGELLRDNEAGLLVEQDELVGLISTWDRPGREATREFFLQAWNGYQSFDADRIGRGHIPIENLCVSMFGGIQPDKLITYLKQMVLSLANDGMVQRFQMMVYPDPWRWDYRDRMPNWAARDKVFAIFKTLSEFDPLNLGAQPADDRFKFPHLSFSPEAQRVYIAWSKDLHQVRIAKEHDPIICQHLVKYDKLFPALALIFHLVDCAARDVGGAVTEEAARRAAAWCEYLEAHARRCYGLLKDDGLRAAQALAKKLEDGALKDGFTARDVRNYQWRNLTTDDAIQPALDWLEDDGWIRGEATGGTGPGSGRRTTRYRLHPELVSKSQTGDA